MKYNALVKEYDTALMSALEPFEKAFEISSDNSLKINIAEYLANILYRFRNQGENYKSDYEKYSTIVKTGKL